jgi:hypothetical protein
MPPPDQPLRDAAASLRRRAEAGDSLAACRLGVELLRCAHLGNYHPEHDQFMAQQEKELEAKGDHEGAVRIALGRSQHAQLLEACSGVTGDAHRYVRQAALAGEPEAMVRYAAGETVSTGVVGMAYLTRPEFDVWRREAPAVLMRALDAGVPEAALLLAQAHAGEGSLLAMLLPRDSIEAGASQALTRRLFGDDPRVAKLVSSNAQVPAVALDAGQIAAAEQRAAEWHERAFQGRTLDFADGTAALRPLHRRSEFEDGTSPWPASPPLVPCDASRQAAP